MRGINLARSLVLASLLAAGPAAGAGDLLAPTREAREQAAARLESANDPLERARLLLGVGRVEEAERLVPDLAERGAAGETLAGRILLASGDLDGLYVVLQRLDRPERLEDPSIRALVYEWLFLVDDLAEVRRRLDRREEIGGGAFVDLLAAGRLERLLLRQGEADSLALAALSLARTPADSAEAFLELGQVSYKRMRFEESLTRILESLSRSPLDPRTLVALSNTLIRLARIADAMDAAELAVEISPLSEDAHYLLGNGYARRTYTRLYAERPDAFADSLGRVALADADALWAAGDAVAARAAFETLVARHPGWADVRVRLGALDFAEGSHREARERFREALAICPGYGRAHNGLAKALEAGRLAMNVHRPLYERRFEETPFPEIPGIDRFVVNWNALSERHKKSVALSIEPWKRFVPVLVEGGASFYIKPLYEILSDAPEQETLHDQRIGYDGRLWDDVRGCGGYHTVTGIEDVERAIHNSYNTVLHELTHQVQGILTADRDRAIQTLYRRTREREERRGGAFLSQYAGGSVWEYFAEGANSFASPKRDGFDTREIVRERLEERDPELLTLVDELMARADVESCYAIAFVNRGHRALEKGDPLAAIESYRAALRRDAVSEPALAAISYGFQVADSVKSALRWADRAHRVRPRSGRLATSYARALWHAGRPLGEVARRLSEIERLVDPRERYLVDLELGRMFWILGRADSSSAACARALRSRSDAPLAEWGLAAAAALDRRWTEAWDLYERALRARSGMVGLRNDYARDLLRAGELGRARENLEASLLLDSREPQSLALRAWLLLEEAKTDSAEQTAAEVLREAPWCDLARLIQARAEAARGDLDTAEATLQPYRARLAAGAPPRFVYRPESGRYDEVQILPAVERKLLVLPGAVSAAPGPENHSMEETR